MARERDGTRPGSHGVEIRFSSLVNFMKTLRMRDGRSAWPFACVQHLQKKKSSGDLISSVVTLYLALVLTPDER